MYYSINDITRGQCMWFRLCRRETSCEQEDFCPPRCNIQVNNNNCLIPVT